MKVRQYSMRLFVVQAVALIGVAAITGPATAGVTYTLQDRQVMYEIEVGDDYNSDLYQDSISAADFGPFDENLYLNVKWPSEIWTDVEGRASVSQTSNLGDTLITATGMSHVHAFVEEDQTYAFAQALAESLFYVEFDLTDPSAIDLSGETDWTYSTVDPPQELSLRVALYKGGVPLFSHVKYYTNSAVVQDDGDTFAFASALAAGSYALEISAYTEAYSRGPWRQYAEGTATYDVTMVVTELYQGDLNCDGSINSLDIDPFVLALTDPAGYAGSFPDCDAILADCNDDGSINSLDIDPFVDLLTGS